MFPSPIETPRLTLRCPTLGDAEAMYANYGRNPRVTRYLSGPTQRSARVLEKAGLRYARLDRAHSVLPALGRQKQDMLRYELARPRGI
jgi:RimJ/RimL family protein N-acetyltransferase